MQQIYHNKSQEGVQKWGNQPSPHTGRVLGYDDNVK